MATISCADEDAFERALVEAVPGVRRVLRRLTGDRHEADDVLQDALARALRYRRSFDPSRGSLGAWLARVARRTAAEHHARRSRLPRSLERDPAQQGESDAATREELERALALLGDTEREIFLRFHAGGESILALSAALGMPVGTVKSHLHRARRRLGEVLEARGFGPGCSNGSGGTRAT